MRRVALTIVSTVAGLGLLLSLKTLEASSAAATSSQHSSAVTHKVSGTFTGDSVDTEYGPVQVAVSLDRGRITSVDAVKTPSDNPRDREIAASAVPTLNREALAAQSADIDAVSGASYTSRGYMDSLQSALDKANA
ncbi:MAG TPA: FMN-binding protein [Stackebrandtia sp.]|jgi:uncharacterized protein with FMN-binding domain|uniref:FMN-binding protein n=1 Tax=Stackebrandtia sp. TaxID=2023065 RepID=UPI002D72DA71|nr:FMN-binding protein [Stackebrandtia sp.]HZE39167.1 FMN-binding protein [Stackebrandtia sp.]